MRFFSRKLTSAFLLLFILTGTVALPANAAVRESASNTGWTEIHKAAAYTSKQTTDPEAFVTSRTAAPAPAVLSSATWVKTGSWLRLKSSNGNYVKGFAKYKGNLYYFNSYGNLLTGFFRYNGKTYYASVNLGAKGKGRILTGLIRIKTSYYFFSPSSSPWPGAMMTGFQTINGRRYYFDSDGRMKTGWFTVNGSKYFGNVSKNKNTVGIVLTGNKKINGVTYSFGSDGKLLSSPSSVPAEPDPADDPDISDEPDTPTVTPSSTKPSSAYMHFIDVSEHQGDINFKKVKSSGVKGVIIRAGYGNNHTDKYFYQNIKNAQSAGLSVGIYWFSYAYTKSMAEKEAKYCLNLIKKYKINLPVYFDWEYDSMRFAKENMRSSAFNSTNWRTLITKMTDAFCSKIKKGGRRPGYYFNLHYLSTYYNPSSLKQYSTWYAYWGKNRPSSNIWSNANSMEVPKKYDLWQFSSRGKIPGISGYVDCDLLLKSSIRK